MHAGHPGLFPPNALIRVVDSESVLILGAPCAVLMQFAHPLVAAGVAEHSSFQQHPFRRVRRTMDLTLGMVFGTKEDMRVAAARINAVHRRVTGVTSRTPYAATDPELLLWVHATLVYSALATYERFVRPLDDHQRFEYYRQSTVPARMLGIPDELFARSWTSFQAYVDQMLSGPVVVTDRARKMATRVLYPVPYVPRMIFAPFAAITAGLLPEPIRRGYGLAWGRPQRAMLRTLNFLLPRVIPHAPAIVRSMPHSRFGEVNRA